jgi:acyl-CoA oxidase
LPGVEISDMGSKIGLNGVDNATLKFNNVRIPRVNMLNKYCDVNEKGEFVTDIKGIHQRFFKVTERLLSGRLCIASMSFGAAKAISYITIRYAQQRLAVSENGKSETPIMEYQLQQNALVPLISRMIALNMLHNFSKTVFKNPKGYENELLSICCIDKTLIGWHGGRMAAIMRERCGGQGFLSANRFGEVIAGAHAAMTAEGDNRVLMVKIVKDYITNITKGHTILPTYRREPVKSIE